MNLLGIDLGIHKIAVAVFLEGTCAHTAAHEVDPGSTRDQQLSELASYVHGMGQLHDVSSVWIEDVIIGNNRKYSLQLAQTLGAVLSDLAHLRYLQGTDARVVDNKTWKKHIIGSGNASKEAVRNYIDVTYPAYAALCGVDQDQYDAVCVGIYGSRILDQAARITLADPG